MTKQDAAVFDIDGTVSDDRWRKHYAEAGDYRQYHLVCNQDEMINGHLIHACEFRDEKIIFATGRPELYISKTIHWLNEKFPGLDYLLTMRDRDDHRPSPLLKLEMMRNISENYNIIAIYDDREDVCDALIAKGWNVVRVYTCAEPTESAEAPTTAADLLRSMADTFEERNAQYGDNWRMVPKLVEILYPEGVPPWLLTDPRWHLFELKLVKLSRFAISELRHADSIHDDGVYSAMIEAIIKEQGK